MIQKYAAFGNKNLHYFNTPQIQPKTHNAISNKKLHQLQSGRPQKKVILLPKIAF